MFPVSAAVTEAGLDAGADASDARAAFAILSACSLEMMAEASSGVDALAKAASRLSERATRKRFMLGGMVGATGFEPATVL